MTIANFNTTTAIDRSKLLERCLGIDAFADKIATAFVATLPTERNALNAAIESSDWTQVAKQAHRLRGSASNVCANELSAAAEAVERAVKEDLIDSTVSLIEKVDSAIDRILREFENGLSLS